jgi:RNA polymerase sigma-70 factor (ECF subfamily)
LVLRRSARFWIGKSNDQDLQILRTDHEICISQRENGRRKTLIRYNRRVANLADNELVARVAKGDEHAFLALYDRYASRVHGLALRILADPMLAEEATQDTFLRLWSRSRQYLAERGSFLAWLLTITRRVALDRLRLESRRPALSDSNDPEEIWPTMPDAETMTEEARWRSLYFAVQSLHEDQRKVIELAYYQGLSQSEIAEVLGWPLGTVKTRLRSAMEKLREYWNTK